MKWWNDLWLKESFAAYLEKLPVSKKYPNWDLATSDYLSTNDRALSYDSSLFTHPIATTELDDKKLSANYDAITYEKVSVDYDIFFRQIKFFIGLFCFIICFLSFFV